MNRIRVLTPVFFSRFFDNEMAVGAGSLRTPFFWLVAFLAVPGMFMPVLMSTAWSFMARFNGLAEFDRMVRADRVIYLAYSAWAVAIVTTTAWHALLLDRRDGLVLGGLPVNGVDVVASKLLSLGGYAGLLMLSMHGGAALTFGLFQADARGEGSLLQLTAAHFIASSLCGLFVFFSIVALQSMALLLGGARMFARLSPVLHLLVVAVVLASGLYISDVANATVDTIAGVGRHHTPWVLKTPALWYLGVYDVILGFRDPVLLTMAQRGMIALGIVLVPSLFALPLSYRNVMRTAVEQSDGGRRRSLLTAAAGVVARLISRRPPVRGVADFFLLSILRHTRPRLALAVAAGAAIARTLPVIALEFANGVPVVATVGILSLPLGVMVFLIAGFRVAATMPSELPARGVFMIAATSDSVAGSAMSRVTLLLAVIAPALLSAVGIGREWGERLALTHFAVCVTTGALLVELAFGRLRGVPCAQPMTSSAGNLRAMWPIYLGGFIAIVTEIPMLELSWFSNGILTVTLITVPLLATIALRLLSSRLTPEPTQDLDEVASVQVLDI